MTDETFLSSSPLVSSQTCKRHVAQLRVVCYRYLEDAWYAM
jgi:hypothetical protein